MAKPVVGIASDIKLIGTLPFHAVGKKYVQAVAEAADAVPMLLPAFGDSAHLSELIASLDGLVFPGSPSNIEPHHYRGEPSRQGTLHDPERDALTLPLIRLAVQAGVPVLGICRGFQEVNVALGGTLHQHVHEVPGYHDHREDKNQPLEASYGGRAHRVSFVPGGWLAGWVEEGEAMVNSLHQQGVQQLAPGLVIEALAPDGLIEAFRLDREDAFVLAVQWHPEWQYSHSKVAQEIFRAFGLACRRRAKARWNNEMALA
jgi:putative glutamine amidotransferase